MRCAAALPRADQYSITEHLLDLQLVTFVNANLQKGQEPMKPLLFAHDPVQGEYTPDDWEVEAAEIRALALAKHTQQG
jgi:hypothetical protein